MPKRLILTSVAVSIALAAMAAPSAGSTAEGASISGKVVDAATSTPLSGTSVAVKGTSLMASTDDAGLFLIEEVPPGPIKLAVSRIGYKSRELSLVATPRVPAQWTIALSQGKH